jgi:hypothetical protein
MIRPKAEEGEVKSQTVMHKPGKPEATSTRSVRSMQDRLQGWLVKKKYSCSNNYSDNLCNIQPKTGSEPDENPIPLYLVF